MIVLLSLLTPLAGAVPVELPAEADPADWAGPAGLAGVELSVAPAGPHARVQVVDGRWRVTVVDRQGRVHVLVVDVPATDEAREDLLATVKSLAEPVDARPVRPVARPLVVPATEPDAPVVKPRTRPTERSVPRDAAPPASEPSQPTRPEPVLDTTPDIPEPRREPVEPSASQPVEPQPVEPDPVEQDPVEAAPGEPRPITVLDPAPTLPPPPPWGLRLSAGTGLHLRARVPAAATVSADVGLERRRLGLELGGRLTPIGRTEALGPLRWWTEGAVRLGAYRAGPGPRAALGGGLTLRHFADANGTVATTFTPRIDARAGWAVPLGPRVALVPEAFLAADAGRTVLSVDGSTKASLAPLSGGLRISVERNPTRE